MTYTEEQRAHPLFKKLSIGLPVNATLEIMTDIFDRYGYLIHSMYSSPPIAGQDFELTDRDFVNNAFLNNVEFKSVFDSVVGICRDYDIKFDMVINSGKSAREVILASSYVSKYNPDELTVMTSNIDQWKKLFPDKVYWRSFNNDPLRVKDFSDERFQGFIGAKQFMWHPELWPHNVKRFRILANNSCLWNCVGCQVTKDWQYFLSKDMKISRGGINEVIARTSMLPEDMVLAAEAYPDITFKLNCRDCYTSVRWLLEDCERIRPTHEIIVDPNIKEEKCSIFIRWHKNGCIIEYLEKNPSELDISKVLAEKASLQSRYRSIIEQRKNSLLCK